METSATGADPAGSSGPGQAVVTSDPARSEPVSVSLVGSTGSIGTQAIEVVEEFPDRFRVVALGAHRSVDLLAAQAHRLRPEMVAIGDPTCALALSRLLPTGVEVVVGTEGLAQIATVAEVAVNGVVGFAGLTVTMAALEAGRRLALANKESIIAGAPVVQRARRTPGAEIIPVDSEHCAVHQCLRAGHREDVERLLLTASGGPFRGWTGEELASVDVAAALVHPTWSMGPKITVDSSTLMNKGLEVIEAHELFGIPYDAIDVVVHPQSSSTPWWSSPTGRWWPSCRCPTCGCPSATRWPTPVASPSPFGAIDWSKLVRARVRASPTGRCSGASTSPTGPAGPATWPRPGSAPPTRWPWPGSSTAGSRGPTSPMWSRARSSSTTCRPDRAPEGSSARGIEDVLDADARARRVADAVGQRSGGGGVSALDTRAPEGLPLDPRPAPFPRRPSRRRDWPANSSPPSPSSWPWLWPPGTSTCSSWWSRIIVIVMIHELGHFLAAKRGGMKVTEYFVGFGPRLWSFRRGETEYGIKALPLGGYVKIPGMTNLEEVDPADEGRLYRDKPFHSRLLVAVAGSAMHFLMAFLLLVALFALVGVPNDNQIQIQGVGALGGRPGPAAVAGLQAGDVVVSVDGQAHRRERGRPDLGHPAPSRRAAHRGGGPGRCGTRH